MIWDTRQVFAMWSGKQGWLVEQGFHLSVVRVSTNLAWGGSFTLLAITAESGTCLIGFAFFGDIPYNDVEPVAKRPGRGSYRRQTQVL
jgi:hypothetical protein